MKNSLSAAVGIVGALSLSTGLVHANGLRQSHPALLAGSIINNSPSDFNEYPWFSHDGKLMLWTRQEGGDGHPQELYITYVKNQQEIAGTLEGTALPPLDLAPSAEFEDIVEYVEDNFPAGMELRAYALCTEEGYEQPQTIGVGANARWRYRFWVYFSVGFPIQGSGSSRLYRAHRAWVTVNKTTYAIASGVAEGFSEVVAGTTANETEPFFSRNSEYFFWASNAWGGIGNVAHYIGPETLRCSQAMQTPKEYDTLPASGTPRFSWRDQYIDNGTYASQRVKTSRTNYHTLVEKSSGRTALIFEECQGQVPCAQAGAGSRDCWCDDNNEFLSTTGFLANGQPSNIVDHPGGPINVGRATHPAISGGQNADGSWLLFYMRGKKIWYTKVKEN